MLLLLLLACAATDALPDTGSEPPTPETELTYYRDVKPIVDAKCGGCHVAGGIGPFPLTTASEVASMRALIAIEVAAKRMPPWPAGPDCNTYKGDRSLSDEQIAPLVTWSEEAGAEGNPADEGPALDGAPEMSAPDLTLPLKVPYTPVESPDDYRCFVLDWEGGDSYITAFGVEPDVDAMVHHVIAYRIPEADAGGAWALDPDGEGYACFGGVGIPNSSWIGAWVPGVSGSDFPEGTGIGMKDGDVIAVQMHYHTSETAEADQTALLLGVDDYVDLPAAVVQIYDADWLVGDNKLIPAGESDWSYDYTTPTGLTPKDGYIWSVMMHMHELGQSSRLDVVREDDSGIA